MNRAQPPLAPAGTFGLSIHLHFTLATMLSVVAICHLQPRIRSRRRYVDYERYRSRSDSFSAFTVYYLKSGSARSRPTRPLTLQFRPLQPSPAPVLVDPRDGSWIVDPFAVSCRTSLHDSLPNTGCPTLGFLRLGAGSVESPDSKFEAHSRNSYSSIYSLLKILPETLQILPPHLLRNHDFRRLMARWIQLPHRRPQPLFVGSAIAKVIKPVK